MRTWVQSIVFGVALAAWGACAGAGESNAVLSPHAGDLVVLQNDRLVPFDAGKFLKAPMTILYFGAGWCPDCRRFSPKLVSAYNAQAGEKKFEVLLIPKDKTEEEMVKFMKAEKMPWPALAFSKTAGADDLNRFYSGKGIPCLTVIDRAGKTLKQSNSDQDAAEILSSFESK
jgi:thiol-disulfide isomerase/thioredoxin